MVSPASWWNVNIEFMQYVAFIEFDNCILMHLLA